MSKAANIFLLCEVCSAKRGAGKLMCLRCWRLVPAPLQRAVNSTWRAFQGAELAARLPALREYRKARDAAILAVRATTTNPNVSGESHAHETR